MSEIRFITSSDEHLSDISPGFRKDNYRDAILSKLSWQGDIGKKYNVNAMLRGGDFFHHKAANRTTHATMQLVSSITRGYQFPTYALAGNHDMTNNDIESVFTQQPLGVLYKTSVFKRLEDEVFTSGSLKVRVVGVDFTPDLSFDALQTKVSKTQDDNYVVAFIHALAANAPSEKMSDWFKEPILDYRDLVFPGCPDVYIFGHYHKDQGIQEIDGVKFVNLGAVSRGSLTFENMERKPQVSLITANSRGIDVVPEIIPHEDASKVFDLERKEKIVKERKSIDDFIHMLRSDSNIKSKYDVKASLTAYPDYIRSRALEILEAAEAGVLDE